MASNPTTIDIQLQNKQDCTRRILEIKKFKNLTWQQMAAAVGRSPVWVTACCLGEASMDEESAQKLVQLLDLSHDGKALKTILMEPPIKAQVNSDILLQDPCIYRLHEITLVYGNTIKELIQEKFGDGIMSAIDFQMEVEKEEHQAGDRVKIVMSGKYLPYKRCSAGSSNEGGFKTGSDCGCGCGGSKLRYESNCTASSSSFRRSSTTFAGSRLRSNSIGESFNRRSFGGKDGRYSSLGNKSTAERTREILEECGITDLMNWNNNDPSFPSGLPNNYRQRQSNASPRLSSFTNGGNDGDDGRRRMSGNGPDTGFNQNGRGSFNGNNTNADFDKNRWGSFNGSGPDADFNKNRGGSSDGGISNSSNGRGSGNGNGGENNGDNEANKRTKGSQTIPDPVTSDNTGNNGDGVNMLINGGDRSSSYPQGPSDLTNKPQNSGSTESPDSQDDSTTSNYRWLSRQERRRSSFGSEDGVPKGTSATPETGSAIPGTGSANPGTGSANPGTGSANPETGSANPGTGSANSGTVSGNPGTGSAKPGNASGNPGSGSAKPETGSAIPGTASPTPDSTSTNRSSKDANSNVNTHSHKWRPSSAPAGAGGHNNGNDQPKSSVHDDNKNDPKLSTETEKRPSSAQERKLQSDKDKNKDNHHHHHNDNPEAQAGTNVGLVRSEPDNPYGRPRLFATGYPVIHATDLPTITEPTKPFGGGNPKVSTGDGAGGARRISSDNNINHPTPPGLYNERRTSSSSDVTKHSPVGNHLPKSTPSHIHSHSKTHLPLVSEVPSKASWVTPWYHYSHTHLDKDNHPTAPKQPHKGAQVNAPTPPPPNSANTSNGPNSSGGSSKNDPKAQHSTSSEEPTTKLANDLAGRSGSGNNEDPSHPVKNTKSSRIPKPGKTKKLPNLGLTISTPLSTRLLAEGRIKNMSKSRVKFEEQKRGSHFHEKVNDSVIGALKSRTTSNTNMHGKNSRPTLLKSAVVKLASKSSKISNEGESSSRNADGSLRPNNVRFSD